MRLCGPAALRWAARQAAPAGGADPLEDAGEGALGAAGVDSWMALASGDSLRPGAQFEAALALVDAHLAARSFLVGHRLSLADLALWGALAVNMLWQQKLQKTGRFPHVARWFAHCSQVPELAATREAFPVFPPKSGKGGGKGGGKSGGGEGKKAKKEPDVAEIKLKGAKQGAVVTRFPPEPSGYLHIGHAKAALLNQYFADKYEGKLLVRFDDTNPSKEKDEYVKNILRDIETLQLKPHGPVTYTSDYFPELMEQATRMIQAGLLYADTTPQEQMQKERFDRVESQCRNLSVEESMRLWGEMQKGSDEGAGCCLRFRLDMKSNNGCMRDPVAYRVNLTPHHRSGDRYKCYPTYDFACPFVDSYEGVTHALRTSEYTEREPQFHWILKAHQQVRDGLPSVEIWDYARLNFVNTVMSKRKLQWIVDQGVAEGWTDPRFPTVQGLRRRGLTIPALKEYIVAQGASKNVTYQEWDKVWTINKKTIDPVCPRHTSVTAAGKVRFTLSGAPEAAEELEVDAHPKNPEVGKKVQVRLNAVWLDQGDAALLEDGEETTLMGWGNAVVEGRELAADGAVTALSGRLHLEGSPKKTKLKVTWLADILQLVPLELRYYGDLITKPRVEDGDKIEDLLNKESLEVVAALGDKNIARLAEGTILQLERKGYFIVDRVASADGEPTVLISIPDGRTKSMLK